MSNIKVLLVSVNAKNIHKSAALWCLKAYCGQHSFGREIIIQENNINENINDILSEIYRNSPDVVGFSCYIWNIELIIKIAVTITKLLPSCKIVLGGPEVSFEKSLDDFPFADYIVQGAGESAFCKLLDSLEKGNETGERIIAGCSCSFAALPSPFAGEYFASFQQDKMSSIENQLVYYESSRGCPFSCAYCLSSATAGVQYLPLERIKDDLLLMLSHGAKCIKFVDRTFNADKTRAAAILAFICTLETECTFHFEAAADLFDEDLLTVIAKMPVNRVQFEIGIQSVNDETLKSVSRKTDIETALTNIKKLTAMKNCHIHVDLIAGLPFETQETFAQAINRCLAAKPHMLQLGFLKMLKGSAIREQSDQFNYLFADYAPYEVFQSNSMTFNDIITLKSVERVIDKFYNSGMFANTVDYAVTKLFKTGYDFFLNLGKYCEEIGNIKVSLKNSYSILLNFLLPYAEKEEAEHYIKLDCLTFDVQGMLPDCIAQYRDKGLESEFRNSPEFNSKSIRVEFFSFDNKKRLFVYGPNNPVSKEYTVLEL